MSDTECNKKRDEIVNIKHLPPLSATASKLLEAVADPGIEIELLAKIIGDDPGLSARILGLANAAYFAQANPVNTIKEAIVRVLGLNMVKSLAMSIAMCGAFDTSKCKGFDLAQYWTAALSCAALSRQIALQIPAADRPDVDSVYLCGLMRNLGALVLAYTFPNEYGRVFEVWTSDLSVDKRQIEKDIVGLTTPQAGEWLADRWSIPAPVVRVIAQHHDRDYTGDFESEVLIVGAVANWLTRSEQGDESALSDEVCLIERLGIDAEALDRVEVAFRDKLGEIHTLANGLV